MYRFDKFNHAVTTSEDTEKNKKKPKFDFQNVNFEDENGEIDPIKTNTTDSSTWFNNTDAISFSFKKKEDQ